MAHLDFDANQHDPVSTDFEPLPAGTYLTCVVGSEMKDTKAGNGRYLQLEFEVLEGEHRGRHLWDRLTLEHPNPTTVQIARGKLSALCRAVGVLTPKDSVELHNLPVSVRVKCKPRTDTGEIGNEISGYKPRAEAQPKSVPATDAGSAAPWKR